MALFSRRKTVPSTPFSDFIRNAKSDEKKRVYMEVLRKATERQNAVAASDAATTAQRHTAP